MRAGEDQNLLDLLQAVTGIAREQCATLLARAEANGADPLTVAISLGLADEAAAYRRLAQVCGFTFLEDVPRSAFGLDTTPHLDALAEHSTLRAEVDGRDVVFVAPKLAQALAMQDHIAERPELAERIRIIPQSGLRAAIAERHKYALLDWARQRLPQAWPFASAHLDLTQPVRVGFVCVLTAVLIAAAAAPFELQWLLVPLLALFLIGPTWFRILSILDQRPGSARSLPLAGDAELPVYSVLLPLRDEAEMVPQLAHAMRSLDYPPEKLDIKFVVEDASPRTIAAVQRELDSGPFELHVVPKAEPLTKPKALNFVLPLVRGAHVVVYDAEDVPEQDQLRRAATLFMQTPAVGCIQAELVADNAEENALTALFAGEYGGLFGIMLPALSRWGFPMPLGGTSNHFRTNVLRRLGGWDAFNVTEDADLGVRLARRRIRTATMTSRTYEEAPVTLDAWMKQRTRWMKQRTRWMKGWMQTFLVHNRRPRQLARDLGWKNLFAFEVYVLGLILTPPLHTLFVIAFAARCFAEGAPPPITDTLTFVQYFILISGYLSALALSVFGTWRLGLQRLMWVQLLLPVYWMLCGVASFRAAYELMVRPYFWAKTRHGETRLARRGGLRGTGGSPVRANEPEASASRIETVTSPDAARYTNVP